MQDRKASDGCAVQDMAWVLARPCLLAIVFAPAVIVVWDAKGMRPMHLLALQRSSHQTGQTGISQTAASMSQPGA